MPSLDNKPISELFSDALIQFSKLMRNEIQLARAEMSQKASQMASAVGLLVGAGLFLIPTLVLLLMAFASWLQELGFRASAAHLIAGGLGLLIVVLLGGIGLSRLKANSLVPNRTINQLQRDAAAAREHV
jgi:uncharacterized protein YacL